jgi:hypothetical protein
VGYPSLASEFPNDNADISGGAIWVCAELTGPATLVTAAYTPVPAEPFVLFFDDDDGYVDGPVELQIDGGALSVTVHLEAERATEAETETETETERESEAEREGETVAFTHFEGALMAALMTQGASRSAALVPRLLRLEALPADALSKDVQLTLQSRGYLDGNQRYSQKYRDLCGAWCAVLRGSSRDFAACGTTTLDRFGAELLAALLAVPATRADELRRVLRKSGIAAFGVLEAA